jgi:hypothetical protein
MTAAVPQARCFICGHFESEFKTKGLWSGGKWHCPNCVKRMTNRKPTDYAYRSECYSCEFYRVNMYGGLSLPDEPENPRYICLKFQAKEPCIYDEPEPPKRQPSSPTQPTGSPPPLPIPKQETKPPTPESLPPKAQPISLLGAVSNLPTRPRLESPAPKRKPQPRRQRR